MLSVLSVSLLGFILGIGHATDPDHVVAVSTIVAAERSPWRAARVGALWGVGHTLTILLAGGAIVLFKLSLPLRVWQTLEMGVAAMLVVLGVLALAGRRASSTPGPWRPMLVGTVHGLAGTGAIVLVVSASIPNPQWATAYLIVFGVGTIAGMVLISTALAIPALLMPTRLTSAHHLLRVVSGGASIALGLFLAIHLGGFQS